MEAARYLKGQRALSSLNLVINLKLPLTIRLLGSQSSRLGHRLWCWYPIWPPV